MEYISSSRYYDTKIQPSLNCYITIGGDNIWKYIHQNIE
jgi:hypothetical protein